MYQRPLPLIIALLLLTSVHAKPRPGIEEHLAETAEETFEVLDPPRIRDSSEQFHQAVESHNATGKLTPAQRHKVLASQGMLLYHRKPVSTAETLQDQSNVPAQPQKLV